MSIRFFFIVAALLLAVSTSFSQEEKTSAELYKEVSTYVTAKSREMSSKGERITRDTMDSLKEDQVSLAGKYAKLLAARQNLTWEDAYFMGMMFEMSGSEPKAMEAYQKFMSLIPAGATGDVVQDTRKRLIALYSKKKLFPEMEKTYQDWLTGKPEFPKQRPGIEHAMAVGYYKGGKYDEAIKLGESAFNLIQKLEARGWAERNAKTDVYADLVELLTYSYRKNKRNEDAINVLAEGRVLSFTIPSARLYRKIMEIVGQSGVSEKKLMQKIESMPAADPAPEITVSEWLGDNATSLEELRGKVVLVDFWATWCGPCISTFPKLRGWHKKYGPKGFEIVGITQLYGSVGGKPASQLAELDSLREFKAEHKLPYRLAVSPKGDTQTKYGVNALPTTVLLDRKGVVRYIGIGAGAEEAENIQEMLDKLIEEQ